MNLEELMFERVV